MPAAVGEGRPPQRPRRAPGLLPVWAQLPTAVPSGRSQGLGRSGQALTRGAASPPRGPKNGARAPNLQSGEASAQ